MDLYVPLQRYPKILFQGFLQLGGFNWNRHHSVFDTASICSRTCSMDSCIFLVHSQLSEDL